MVHITNFISPMNNGVTQPSLIEASDEKQYVLKCLSEGYCNGKGLFNELIAHRLGTLLGIPMPPMKILYLTSEMIESNHFFKTIEAIEGPCFASEYRSGIPNIGPPILKKITNQCDIPAIILFDQLILNNDRSENPGNLYFDKKTKKLLAIDHSHIFKQGLIWQEKDIVEFIDTSPITIENLNGVLYRYFSPYVNGNSPFAKICQIMAKVEDKDLLALFDSVPAEWDISEAEKKIVYEFFKMQFSNVHGIMDLTKDHFKNWKGAG
ncbi:HipA family kinase [Carnobacterium divergens]|uniref:HipA family kinase n=1 Tax=Carnobacterium divergens TaxID=2748 RepID=UPI0039C9246F